MFFKISYLIIFLISVFALLYMTIRKYRNVDVYYWTLLILMPIICMAYVARVSATTVESAMLANDLTYLDGTILPVLLLFGLLRSLKIKFPQPAKAVIFTFAILHVLLVWFGSKNGLYYKSMELVIENNQAYLQTQAGSLKFLHFIYLGAIVNLIAVYAVYGFRHPEKCSRKTIMVYSSITLATLVCYILQLVLKFHYDIVPFVYAFASWMVALTYEKTFSHNIDGIVMSMNNDGADSGYIAFDMKKRFLGANDRAMSYLPQLAELKLDKQIGKKYQMLRILLMQMMNSIDDGENKPRFVEDGDKIFKYELKFFYIRKNEATGGYLFIITDDTEHQRSLNFIKNYNDTLKIDVQQRTEHIRKIQEKVVLGLAVMIENRDESTGGHAKRTSDIIEFIVDAMMELKIGNLDVTFAQNIKRAAPMHDIGKIAIEDSILKKRGKLTDDEYARMKTHPAVSGDVINKIFRGVEDPDFVDVAFNVARYHHEKWNGEGYPEKLSGTDIPMEARIMAVADVYDALVSKRCYKEPMNFEDAANVMMENMGTHFDPIMKDVFVYIRPKLEDYYSRNKDS